MEGSYKNGVFVVNKVFFKLLITILLFLIAPVLFSHEAFGFSATISTADDVETSVMPNGENGIGTSITSEEINVVSDCRAGYNLTIQGPNDSNLYLDGDSGNNLENKFFTVSDGESMLKNSSNTWGFSLTANTDSGVFSPLTSSGTLLKTVAQTAVVDTDINDTFPIYYGVAVSKDIVPGAYSMASGSSIVYQLTMSPMCIEYDIVYDGNGADGGNMVSNGEELIHSKVIEGEEITLYAPNYSKTNYGYLGWSLDADAATKITDNNPNNDPLMYGPNETFNLSEVETRMADNQGDITMYAVWIASEGNLQGWNGCDDLSATTYNAETGKLKMTNELTENSGVYAKSVTALKDTRDNEVYAVAKLTDGKCWTIENLRLNLENVEITRENTNHPSEWFMNNIAGKAPTSFEWGTSYNPELLYNVDNMNRELPSSHDANRAAYSWFSYGGYYKYAVTSAGTYSNTNNNPSPGDICPSGWRLPVGSTMDYAITEGNEFQNLYLTMGSVDGKGSKLFRSVPNNFVLGGLFTSTAVEATNPWVYELAGRGLASFYASSIFYLGDALYTRMSGLRFSTASLDTGSSHYRYASESIRCMSRDEEVAEVTYSANGGENAPASIQSTPGRGLYVITVSNSIPTRTGYTFVAWADKRGREYHGGDTFTTDLKNDTLYAIWSNNSCNSNATSISNAVCLQDVNTDVRASMANKTNYTLVDARDNKPYTLAVLDDGNVWMTQNLNLGGDSETLVSARDSDLEAGKAFVLPASNSTFINLTSSLPSPYQTLYVFPQVYNSDSNGGYYSFAATIASSEPGAATNSIVSSSVCPAGWDLPSSYQYDYLKTRANLGSSSSATAAPYNFVEAGYVNGSTINSGIRLWTSTNNDNVFAYYSGAYSLATSSSNVKYYGESVRCIKSNGNAVIIYHGNGDSAYPVDSPDVVQETAQINSYKVKESSFNRTSWSFDGWNTQSDGSGEDVAVGGVITNLGISENDTLNLYARWNPQLAVVYHSNDVNNIINTEYVTTGATYRTGGAKYFDESHHRVASWNTNPDGSGTSYTLDTDYTAPSGMVIPDTLNLYAQWEPTYTIVYDGNGSDGDDIALMETVYHAGLAEGDTISLYASNFSRAGYGFAGWSFDPDAAEDLSNATIYGPNENITVPAYTTDEIKLYAVWLLADQADTFQTFSVNNRCDSMAMGDILALTDERDGNVYTVAKLADDNCWMTENLRLALDAVDIDVDGRTIVGAASVIDGSVNALSKTNTNNPSSDFLHASVFSNDWQLITSKNSFDWINIGISNINRDNEAAYNDTGDDYRGPHQDRSWYSYGVMYSWYAATAGRGLSTDAISTNAVSGDICPVGWHLARGTNTGELYILNSTVNSLVAFPNNFIYSGEYYSFGDYRSTSSISNNAGVRYPASRYRGTEGWYWLSNNANSGVASVQAAALFNIRKNGNNILTSDDGLRGNAVRCLSNAKKTFTLEYVANGGENAPSSEVKADVTVGSFSVSSVEPVRSGYTFAGWSDEDGNSYEAGDNYIVPYASSTGYLYAKWVNNLCNPSATSIDDAVCLQDINSGIKATMDFKETYTLIDARDNKEYTVALLDDNNVWMTQNLSFGVSEATLLTSDDTDLASGLGVVLPASVTSFASNRSLNHLVNATYGGYYNFYAATLNKSGTTATTSICPKGWDLPTRAQYNDFQAMSGVNTLAKAQASPYNYQSSGYRSGTSFYNASISMWTSESYYDENAYASNVYEQIGNSSGSYSGPYSKKYYGRAVRCVINNGVGTVYYDANGGGGTMNPQVDVVINTTTLSSNGFTAPNAHKQFKEWNTRADGSGIAVKSGAAVSSTGLSDGEAITLYAQWEDVYIVTYVNTANGATQTKNFAVGSSISIRPSTVWSRSGYFLKGWDTDPSGETTVYDANASVVMESDITIYTVWKQYYTINYDINTDDPNAEGVMTNNHGSVYEGTRISLIGSNFSRTNYGFAGWSFDPNAASDVENATIYGPSESFDAPPYTASTVSLYAVWIPSSGNLQDFECSSLGAGGVTALTDTRDGDTYAVAKLADGKCWMIENMRLNSSANASLMATDSQGIGGNFTVLPASSSSWSSSSSATTDIRVNTTNINRSLSASPYNSGNSWYAYGNYYSWPAAIADDSVYTAGTVAEATSICPAGWHLPNGGSLNDSDFYQLTLADTGLAIDSGSGYSGNDRTAVYFALQSFPNNFVRAGYWSGSSASNRSYDMRYWANRAGTTTYSGSSNANDAYVFYYTNGSTYAYPGTYAIAKYFGASVRCIADQ